MPTILAIDSSSSTTRVALWREDDLTEYKTDQPRQAAQQILPLIQRALDAAKLAVADLHAIAIATGPGSFTGLRIGIGVAQGLSAANSTPLIAVSSLALLAMAAARKASGNAFLVCLPARDQEVYFGAYCKQDSVVVLQDRERVIELGSGGPDRINIPQNDWLGIGPGWQYREQLEKLLEIELSACDLELNASMEDLCIFALEKLNRGDTVTAEHLLPNYVKEQLDYRS